MVVTRRQSASPIPPAASRTSSSTGSSRSSKGKGVDKSSPLKDSSALNPSYVPPNGTPSKPPPVGPRQVEDIKFDDDLPSVPPKPTLTKSPGKSKSKPKSKKSSKPKKHRPNKGISAFDIIARIFLLWLTIYTLSVCPEDIELRSPVCRALTEYRRVFLEPYIYPPIRAALDHPAVAPHIQRVQPYYNHAVRVSTPWVRRGKREWRARVVPQIHWLQLRARPYILRAERHYDVTLGPYVRQVSNAALWYRLKAEPYVLAAAVKSHRTWETAKPYLMPAWRQARRIPGIVVVYVGGPLGQARRQWVDPQVTKIWDAVVEQGKADTSLGQAEITKNASFTPASSTAVSSASTTPATSSTVSVEDVTSTVSVATISPPLIPEPADEAAASASSIMAESALLTESSTPSAVESSVPSVAEPSVSPIVDSSTSTVTESLATASSSEPASFSAPPIPEQTDEAAASASSIIRETESLSPSSADEQILAPSDAPTGLAGAEDEDENIVDLEDFLSQLDADSSPKVEEPPPEPEESEEQREERLRLFEIEKAEKRADVEARHTQWEIDLEKFGKSQRKVVRTTLKKLRDAASEEARATDGPVRTHIEALVQDAERSLKSLRAYSRKLASETTTEVEKFKSWETVVQKVDKKFGERVDTTADTLREWWDAKIDEENGEISQISWQVRSLADRAQDDLGFDYTWLPGVTYDDWQRYHKLVRVAKDFAELYAGMQNGTVPNAPANPVSDIMEAIQEEVDDMILGFEANLGRIKTAAIDSFSATKSDSPVVSDARKVPSHLADESVKAPAGPPVTTSGSNSVPEVSILPINPSYAKEAGVPPVILSRGAEEVESAVSKAEEAKTKAAHSEL